MKTHRLTLITSLAFCTLLIASCKKDDKKVEEKKQLTKSEQIQANIWVVTSLKAGSVELFNTAFVQECQKDNTLDFQPNDILLVDEGETKCKDTDPQTAEGEWKLIDDTRIYLNFNFVGNQYNDTADIVSLSDTKLVIKAFMMNIDAEVTFSKK